MCRISAMNFVRQACQIRLSQTRPRTQLMRRVCALQLVSAYKNRLNESNVIAYMYRSRTRYRRTFYSRQFSIDSTQRLYFLEENQSLSLLIH